MSNFKMAFIFAAAIGLPALATAAYAGAEAAAAARDTGPAGTSQALATILSTAAAGAGAIGLVRLTKFFGIGDWIKEKYPTSEKRLKAWANSLRKVLHSLEVSCRKQIDLIYQ